jgi:conjugative relaxase-like TrwC/TraI family protein
MLSLSRVSAAQAGSYFTKDDYYTKEQGQWQGRGAEALGLRGPVEKEDFKRLIQGLDREGNPLVISQNGREHRAGVDLTFSAPKSVSILSEVVGDRRVREAHQQAVSRTLEFIEKHFSQARNTERGITQRVDTGNLVIAKFDHETSRTLDPQLHTHAVVMNMTQRPDGEWRALSNEKLYEQKILLGQVYRNELAHQLKELGYGIQTGKSGLFEVKGIDGKLIQEFSVRREQILKALDGRESGGELAEKVALMSREAKTYEVDRSTLKKEWLTRAAELGYTKEQIQEQALQGRKEVQHQITKDHLTDAIRSLEVQTVVWSREEMMKSALKSGISDGLTLERVESQIGRALERGGLVQLDINKYSSREAIKTEQKIVELVQSREPVLFRVDAKQINAVIKEHGAHLNAGQQAAVRHITGSRDTVIAVQGYAGVGKTSMLSVANQVWERQGFSVQGLSFTGKAAETLQSESGIKSQTIHSFLSEREQADRVQIGRQVWVVDEASMVGNRQMLDLLKAAERDQAKVILIGDRLQLQAIDAGKPFQMLQEKGIVATARMDDLLRQKTEGLREAVEAVAKEKNTDRAIHLLEKMGGVKEIENRSERLKSIAQDYLALSSKEMKGTLIVTARNTDRVEINRHIRDGLKERGQLHEASEKNYHVAIPKAIPEGDRGRGESFAEGDGVRFLRTNQRMEVSRGERGIIQEIQGDVLKVQMQSGRTVSVDLEKYPRLEAYSPEVRQFAPGDQVMFLRNDKGLGVVNGTVGRVVEAGEHALKIETRTGMKEVDLKQYNHLDHSYGSTLHKSQGRTAERVMLHIDTRQGTSNSANAFYVGVNRASHEATIYTDSKAQLPDAVRPWQSKESAMDYEKENRFDHSSGKESEKAISLGRGLER